MCALRDRTARPPEYLGCVTAFRTRGSIPCAAMRLSLHEKRRDHFRHAFCLFNCLTNTPLTVPCFVLSRVYRKRCRGGYCVKSHIVYRLCNHMVYTLSLIQPGVIVQEIALFECVNSLVQVDAADSELSEHQCDLPRERRLANGDAFPTKPFA